MPQNQVQTQLDVFRQDLRYAFRAVRRDWGFFLAAGLIIALGIAANSTIFSLVHGILMRPLTFANADRLVWVANSGTSGLSGATSRVANYLDWKELNHSFEDMSAYFAFFDYGTYTMTGAGQPERLVGVGVAQNFLPFLGIPLQLGRNFTAEEALDNGPAAVILSHGLWERRFGADTAIIGKAIRLNDKAITVVGVLPAEFDFRSVFTPGSRSDMLVPFPITQRTDRWGNTLAVIGRLKPGVNIAQAQADFDVINQQIQATKKDRYTFGARMTPLHDQLTGRFQRGLMVLLGAVGLVLLIACTNLSNLLLARATSRRKEIAIRSALGATRSRLISQMLTESILLALAGGAGGLALAYSAIAAVRLLRDVSIPLLATVQMDGTVLLFTAVTAMVTGILMGVVPALQVSGTSAAEAMKESGRGTSEGRTSGWTRSALVLAQVALACVLLVGAGLLIRSFQRVLDIDMGFRTANAASWRVETTEQRYPNDATRRAFYDRLMTRVLQVPGVESAGFTDALPLSRDRSWGMGVPGVQYPPGQYPIAHPRLVDWRYTSTMGIRLLAGRLFSERDTPDSERVVIVNERAAKTLWPGESAVDKLVNFGGSKPSRVVGVVANVRHETLEAEGGMEGYLLVAQNFTMSLELVVRAKLPVSAVAPAVRQALQEIDPLLPAAEYQTLDTLIDRAVSPRRFLMLVLGGFAGAALLLASIGIYGVVSYSVGQRTQEIGIRMALGAQPGEVRRLVMVRTAGLSGVGIALGVGASLLLGRLTESLLYGMEPGDPRTFAVTIGTLLLVSLLASYLPARRAARVDPMIALRSE